MTYEISWRENENTKEHPELPVAAELDEVRDLCRDYHVAADLLDATGFRRGHVDTEGDYQLV